MKDFEPTAQFETRKADHIRVAMDPRVQSLGSGFDGVELIHEALPEIDFDDVSIATQIFSNTSFEVALKSPFFISSMTGGHRDSHLLNQRLAASAEERGWAMGVGSQRRELSDPSASAEWAEIRRKSPSVVLFGNIGLSQLISTPTAHVRRLFDSLQAKAMIVHLNPLQEVLQVEGTPRFRGGLDAIGKLVRELGAPVVVKETGCGISGMTARRLFDVGVHAIDVAGRGGTHWGLIEGERAKSIAAFGDSDRAVTSQASVRAAAAESLRAWGISTVDSLCQVVRVKETNWGATAGANNARDVWASGGIRSGLDGAKALALGAQLVGVAQPLMAAALLGESELLAVMRRFDFELKSILFCQGARDLKELKSRGAYVHGKGGGL